jgi:hypothetical protein
LRSSLPNISNLGIFLSKSVLQKNPNSKNCKSKRPKESGV